MLDNRGEGDSEQSKGLMNVNNSANPHPYNSGGAGIAENRESNINVGFVLGHTITIALGFA